MRRVLSCLALVLLNACGGQSAEQVACEPPERVPVQGGGHLIGAQEPSVAYNSTPPTSGFHTSAPARFGVHDEPLTEPEQVRVLEAGGVVVAFSEIAPDEQASLEALVREELTERVALTPYAELEPGTVTLTAWGVLQRCPDPDVEAVVAFVREHAATEHAH